MSLQFTFEITQAEFDVLAERSRQINVEGWTPEHDDQHSGGDMAMAAAAYAAESAGYGYTNALKLWPWSANYWKPKEARSNLVRAAALLVAEIERIDRAEARSKA